MSSQDNKAVMRRFWDEFYSQGNVGVVDEIVGDELRDWREGEKDWMPTVRAAFPDTEWRAEEMFAEGDTVVSKLRFRGTHRGVFDAALHGVSMAVPLTGKVVEFTAVSIDRVVDGKVTEHHFESDVLSSAVQIGAVPTTNPPAT